MHYEYWAATDVRRTRLATFVLYEYCTRSYFCGFVYVRTETSLYYYRRYFLYSYSMRIKASSRGTRTAYVQNCTFCTYCVRSSGSYSTSTRSLPVLVRTGTYLYYRATVLYTVTGLYGILIRVRVLEYRYSTPYEYSYRRDTGTIIVRPYSGPLLYL